MTTNISNLSNVCLSIRSSNRATSEKRGYASTGKTLISFSVKAGNGGVATLKAFPKPDKMPSYMLMNQNEYESYGRAVKAVYNKACAVNLASTNGKDPAIIKVHTDDFYHCVSDLATVVFGESFSMQEYPNFGSEILAMAKTYLPSNMDGDTSPANMPINKFVKALEPMMLSVASYSVFLKDYERDYNLAVKRCTARINKATAQLAKAEEEYNNAQTELSKAEEQVKKDSTDTTIKESTKKNHAATLGKAQALFDEKKNILDTIKNTIDTWKIKLSDAEKTFEEAKVADTKKA